MEKTQDCQTQEKIKARLGDPWWRLNNLYYIMDEKGRRVKFSPNWAQRLFYRTMWFLNIILKARQLGFTTFIQIFMLDRCLFNSNVRAGVIAHNKEDAQTFFRDKIKFAYDNLPEWLRQEIPAVKNDAGELLLANNSSIRVGTSMRSGTLQYLHISEFGKICRKYPEKAQEIVTGSLNTVHAGHFVFIESTAEGRHGRFFEMSQAAKKLMEMGRTLTKMQYKFHFFPWWKDDRYRADPDGAVIDERLQKYFQELKRRYGIDLDAWQMAWYAQKEAEQKDKMKQEFPSTDEEAFEQAIEGAFYSREMSWLRRSGRVTTVPHDPRYPVHTFWDIGRNDMNAIWFMQSVAGARRFIHYYENHDYPIQHYGKYLKETGWFFGTCYLPHDGENKDYTQAESLTRAEVLAEMGFTVETVARVPSQIEGVQAVRDALPLCWFDEAGCKDGINALDSYQREWDEKLGAFKEQPLHNWASHGSKAFEQFARGFDDTMPLAAKPKRKKRSWKTI